MWRTMKILYALHVHVVNYVSISDLFNITTITRHWVDLNPRPVFLTILAIFPSQITAQQSYELHLEQQIHYCTPPPAPILDPVFLTTIGSTPGQEYSAFFDSSQDYLNCLEASKRDWIDQVNSILKQYQEAQRATGVAE
ncbi:MULTISPECIES: hypothetical protein [unclassified Sulfitobacter]|uniref:hypothetical protein n=1 Tax=unclassified Sulfitobacter TaxID=196795 RepID=UPI003745734B